MMMVKMPTNTMHLLIVRYVALGNIHLVQVIHLVVVPVLLGDSWPIPPLTPHFTMHLLIVR